MVRLVWDDPDKRLYEFGIDRGVFCAHDGGEVVPWSGLIAVSEAPSGSDFSQSYYDGRSYHSQRSIDSFSATIEAFTYPKEFEPFLGIVDGYAQQRRHQYFNFSYRTRVGNGPDTDDSYKIHLVYNASVSPTNRSHKTHSQSLSAQTFSWVVETVPELLTSGKISAHIIVDSKYAYPWALEELERRLYGSSDDYPYFPGMREILDLFEDASILTIIDNGDGTWTADGPDDVVVMIDDTNFEISWPSAVYIDEVSYHISSL